jgi:hypothetical protein
MRAGAQVMAGRLTAAYQMLSSALTCAQSLLQHWSQNKAILAKLSLGSANPAHGIWPITPTPQVLAHVFEWQENLIELPDCSRQKAQRERFEEACTHFALAAERFARSPNPALLDLLHQEFFWMHSARPTTQK